MNRNPLLQTIATPREERRPTVFISYSRQDKEHADRLIEALNAEGMACWKDTDSIPGGDDWMDAIAKGIINSFVVVPVVTSNSLSSTFVRKEILWAQKKEKPIIPWVLEDVMNDFFHLVEYQGVNLFDCDEYAAALSKLIKAMPPLSERVASVVGNGSRQIELAYLDRLRLEELINSDMYTPLAGLSHQKLQPVQAKQVFALMAMTKDRELRQERRRFENAVEEILQLRRAALLGEPGGGKTTTIWKLAAELVETALQDDKAPIPLLVRLGKWTDAEQTLQDFIASQLGELGEYLDALLSQKRAALLLDGLNELPTGQRDSKYPQVKSFIEAVSRQHPMLLAVVSCREQDYRQVDLGFNLINITPLDPIRIRDFVVRYLGKEQGEVLFWTLAGQEARERHEQFLNRFGRTLDEPERAFWLGRDLPDVISGGWQRWYRAYEDWGYWLKIREAPSSLMILARNPYMLLMLTSVFAEQGKLPENRGDLFRLFVEKLLRRENEREEVRPPEQAELTKCLAKVAYEMQIRSTKNGRSDASTVLTKAETLEILNERQLYLADSASILDVGEQVRFTHQLLQEYFAAKLMDIELNAGGLSANRMWPPDKWWQRTNWDIAAVLLAGLYSADCSKVVEWVAEANPEVAAECVIHSGAALADVTRERLRKKWIARLTDTEGEPQPLARAAIGRALGLTNWDNRKGVGVIERQGTLLPDIDWVEIPEGEFQYGDKSKEDNQPKKLYLSTFYISRYPVTYCQFKAFLDDPEGCGDPRWFKGLPSSEAGCQMEEQRYRFANHPRDTVTWYQAIAFCRWLSWRMRTGYSLKKVQQWAVRLPTEFEWEKAARGTDGRLYSYGNNFDLGKANIDARNDRIGQTSAVGIYPKGASPYGVEEMSGNVFEWCLNNSSNPKLNPDEENLLMKAARVLRGGSWSSNADAARAVCRGSSLPTFHSDSIGFRLMCLRLPSS